MSSRDQELETFLLESCRELGIPVKPLEPARFALEIPSQYRRELGGQARIEVSTAEELKRYDAQLELFVPGSYIFGGLTSLVAGGRGAPATLVTEPPEGVETEALMTGFARRFLDIPPGESRPRLERARMSAVIVDIAYHPFLRAVFEVEFRGGRHVHEVLPVLVDLRALRIAPASQLARRRTYAPAEAGLPASALPTPVSKELVARGFEVAVTGLGDLVRRLGSFAVDGHKLEQERSSQKEAEKYYKQRAEEDPARRDEFLEMARNGGREILLKGGLHGLKLISLAVVHDTRPEMRVTLDLPRERRHTIPVPLIPGSAEIPDDVVVCGHRSEPLAVVPGRGLACLRCAPACAHCTTGVWGGQGACKSCFESGGVSCDACVKPTADGTSACERHVFWCASGELNSTGTEATCAGCGELVCGRAEHRFACGGGADVRCARCALELARCVACEKLLCPEHVAHTQADEPCCPRCLVLCTIDGGMHPKSRGGECGAPAGSRHWVCTTHLASLECGHGSFCTDHAVMVDGHPVCDRCAVECVACPTTVRRSREATCAGPGCDEVLCRTHAATAMCAVCEVVSCPVHATRCRTGGELLCTAHSIACAQCHHSFRDKLTTTCEECKRRLCGGCAVTLATGKRGCPSCAGPCAADQVPEWRDRLHRCEAPSHAQAGEFCAGHLTPPPCCGARVCAEHLVAVSCVHGFACWSHAVKLASGATVCSQCAVSCATCSTWMDRSAVTRCSSDGCAAGFCSAHATTSTCALCEQVLCPSHAFRCTAHGGESLFCADHLRSADTCGHRVCPAHMAASAISHQTVCSACSSTCASCHDTLAPREGVACPCGMRYCDHREPAPRCLGGEVRCSTEMRAVSAGTGLVCREHEATCSACPEVLYRPTALVCVAGGEVVCERHAVRCASCKMPACAPHVERNRLAEAFCKPCWSRATRCARCADPVLDAARRPCGSCQKVFCRFHQAPCRWCGRVSCGDCTARTPAGEAICPECSVSCASCRPTLRHRPDAAHRCPGGNHAVCPEHAISCRVDGVELCPGCALSSPLTSGHYCPSHLESCISCGMRAQRAVPDHALCELCCVVVRRGPDSKPLPFDRGILDAVVRGQSGLAGRFLSAMGLGRNVHWRVGERFVLVWIQGSALASDVFRILDNKGQPATPCTPSPPPELLR